MSRLQDDIKSILRKAYDIGIQEGMKQEHAMWELTAIGQEIESIKQKPLTKNDICKILADWRETDEMVIDLCRRIEAAHGIK